MSNDKKPEYFNFPICLLKDAILDIKPVMYDIAYYIVYQKSTTFKSGNNKQKINEAAKYFGIEIFRIENLSIANIQKRGKLLIDSIPEKTPTTGIKIKIWYDFLVNDKSDFEVVVLLAFLAIKSILGKSPKCKTNIDFLFSRMSGEAKGGNISELLIKYSTRRHFQKIINKLKLDWSLTYYSYHTTGFYVSFELDYNQLCLYAESRKNSNRLKKIKSEESVIRKIVTVGIQSAKYDELSKNFKTIWNNQVRQKLVSNLGENGAKLFDKLLITDYKDNTVELRWRFTFKHDENDANFIRKVVSEFYYGANVKFLNY